MTPRKNESVAGTLLFCFAVAVFHILLFPAWAVMVLYASIRAIVKWEDIGPYS